MSKIEDLVSRFKELGFAKYRVNYLIITHQQCARFGVKSPTSLLDELIGRLDGSILIMNGFNWDFCRGENYHYKNSTCQTGLINEYFNRRECSLRGNHPIYSYVATGDHAAELVNHQSATCWGPGSTSYEMLHDPQVRLITFGVPFTYSMKCTTSWDDFTNLKVHCTGERYGSSSTKRYSPEIELSTVCTGTRE